ncbi:MAG: hypothetical protein ABSC10_17610 [Candidatus Acidiferrales bacterium]|jgi:hypothetical protein
MAEGTHIETVPLGRNIIRELIEQVSASCILENLKPVFEGIYSANGSVCGWTPGEPTPGCIREIPSAPVEAEPVVDHYHPVILCGSVGHKDYLAAIHVARPFVKHQHAGEVRSIRDFPLRKIGQKAVGRH